MNTKKVTLLLVLAGLSLSNGLALCSDTNAGVWNSKLDQWFPDRVSQRQHYQAQTKYYEAQAELVSTQKNQLVNGQSVAGVVRAAAPLAIAFCAPIIVSYLLNKQGPSAQTFLFEFSKPTEKMSSIAGKQPVQINTIIEKLKHPEYYLAVNPKATVGNLLLYGAPGTGKTQRARALAAELECCFSGVTPVDLQDMYYGGAARKVRQWFADARTFKPKEETLSYWERAKKWTNSWFKKQDAQEESKLQKPYCILFVDEIDGFTTRANLNADHRSGHPLDTFLEEMTNPENKGILVVGACNQTNLDPALSRRFADKVEIKLPDQEDLSAIFDHFAKDYNFSHPTRDYDYHYNDEVGTKTYDYHYNDSIEIKTPIERREREMYKYKFSGDDVRNMLIKAADAAARKRRLITQEDLDEAIMQQNKDKKANEQNKNPKVVDLHTMRAQARRAAVVDPLQKFRRKVVRFLSPPRRRN